MRDVKYQYPGHLHIKYEVNLLIFELTLIYTPGLGRVKINFVSALNFGYICPADIYTLVSRQSENKFSLCSRLWLYLHMYGVASA